MGGFSVVVMLGLSGVMVLVVLGAVFLAAALFIAATVISIVFVCQTKSRRQQGKRLKGLLAIPIVFYAVSIPILVWFALALVVPIATDVEGDEYSDFSVAVANDDLDALRACFEADRFEFQSDGPESLSALFTHALDYGDAACAQEIRSVAANVGTPIDVNTPLENYTEEGEPYDAEYALVRVTKSSYLGMSQMVLMLLAAGADPNVVSLQDTEGKTPLHMVCDSVDWIGSSSNADRLLEEAGQSIEALLSYGADPAAVDKEGRTAADILHEELDALVEEGAITREQADRFCARYAADLDVE